MQYLDLIPVKGQLSVHIQRHRRLQPRRANVNLPRRELTHVARAGRLVDDGCPQPITLDIEWNPFGVVFDEPIVKLKVLHFQIENPIGKILLPPPLIFWLRHVGGTVRIHGHTDLRLLHRHRNKIHLPLEQRDNPHSDANSLGAKKGAACGDSLP